MILKEQCLRYGYVHSMQAVVGNTIIDVSWVIPFHDLVQQLQFHIATNLPDVYMRL